MRLLLLWFILFSSLYASSDKIFELLADSVTSKDKISVAKGNAILISSDNYIIADEIIYDANIRQAIINGNIKIYKGNSLFLKTDKVILNLEDDYSIASPFYMQDSDNGLWISANIATRNKDIYKLKKTSISGCKVDSPIWRLDATSGTYNAKNSFVKLWNPVVYIGDIPIMYLPFMAFSASNKRSSGLLYPSIGMSSSEGFVYLQPIYMAVQDSWDMTFTPQVRTSRGTGLDIELRAVDKLNNKILLNGMYFYNFDNYMKNYTARNQNIYGFNLLYQVAFPKVKSRYSDLDMGLYIDFAYMNDIDYLRLQAVDTDVNDSSYTSKLNFYLQSEGQYLGFNLKYFLDMINLSNSTTFQTLPSIQYHKYLSQFFTKYLLYSIDYKLKNITRERGYGYIENKIKLPVGFNFPLFNRYLSLGVTIDLTLDNVTLNNTAGMHFYNNKKDNKNGLFFTTNYSVSLTSDLARSYNRVFHTMGFEAKLTGPFYHYTDGILKRPAIQDLQSYALSEEISSNNIWDPDEIIRTNPINEVLSLSMQHYLYNLSGRGLLSYKIAQDIDLSDKDSYFKMPLESKLEIYPVEGLKLGLDFFYSFYHNEVDEASASIGYVSDFIDTELSYYFKASQYLLGEKVQSGSNYLKFHLKNDFGYFGFATSLGYDIEKNLLLDWDISLSKNIRCFGFALTYANERKPILTNNPSHPIKVIQNSYVMLDFRFVPLTSLGLKYNLNKEK